MIFGCPISERINLEDGVVFGIEESDIADEVVCYKLQADSEDIPPANIHTLDLPLEWPFLLDINDYDAKDEPSVRTINSISMTVDFMRRMSSNLSSAIESLAEELSKVERGHDTDIERIERGMITIFAAEHFGEYVQECGSEFSILADQCPSTKVTELEQWCNSVVIQCKTAKNRTDQAVVYNERYNKRIGRTEADVDSVIAEQQYVDEMIDAYKAYETATTDVDLEGIVDDIYSTMDPIEVSL